MSECFWPRVLGLMAVLALARPAAAQMFASQVLAGVSQAYGSLQSYQIVAEEDVIARFGQSAASSQTKLSLTADGPGKIRLDREDGGGRLIVVSNGEATWTFVPSLHQYTRQDVAVDLSGDEESSDDPVSQATNILIDRYRSIDRLARRPGSAMIGSRLRIGELTDRGGSQPTRHDHRAVRRWS
ncbi:MAG TPA: hypothetical protein VI455_15635 [Terriglobia bacterium]